MPDSATVFIDTNIYGRVVSQGLDGCEVHHFEKIKAQVDECNWRLLVPEFVVLELEKFYVGYCSKLDSEIDQIHNEIKSVKGYNELTSLRPKIKDSIDSLKSELLKAATERYKAVRTFLDSANVSLLPFDSENLLAAFRSVASGKRPGDKVGGDMIIMEALVRFFRDNGSDGPFYFCTENHKDFAQELHAKGKERKFRLHKSIQDRLPVAIYCSDLAELLAYIDKQAEPPTTTLPPESDYGFPFTWSLSPPIGTTGTTFSFPLSSGVYPYPMFDAATVTQLFPQQDYGKGEMVRATLDIVQKCRQTASWNSDSEKELPRWLDGFSENELYNASVEQLAQIYKNLLRYLQRHLELDKQSRKRV